MKLWNFKREQNTISEALQVSLPEHAVISVVGAGGKTSLIFAWAQELASEGKTVVISTTTHMMHPEFAKSAYPAKALIYYSDYSPSKSELAEDFAQIDSLLESERILMLASVDPSNNHKVTSPPQELLDYTCAVADVVLIEADGSRRMPLKWPKAHEPVVPKNTAISICVAGLSALGRPLQDALYNAEGLPQAMSRDTIDEALIAAIVSSPDGGLKGTHEDYRVFLNQADTEELQEKATHIQALLAVRGIQSAWGTLY